MLGCNTVQPPPCPVLFSLAQSINRDRLAVPPDPVLDPVIANVPTALELFALTKDAVHRKRVANRI